MGQCPTMIDDDGGDGTVYYMTLANGATECVNYSADITINGVAYSLTNCEADLGNGDGSGEVEFTIVPGGTAVVIATDAPITIVNGATCTYDASGNPAVLPVELTYFKGEVIENNTYLTWQTASEEINKGFEVQRSVDGANWEVLDFVVGAGTTLTTQNYEYTDNKSLAGTSYYRLKQLDLDGQFEYSTIVEITMGALNQETLKIFPNPVTDVLNIMEGQQGQGMIYNAIGQVVQSFSIQRETIQVSTSHLPKGQYILHIQQENGNRVIKRFMK